MHKISNIMHLYFTHSTVLTSILLLSFSLSFRASGRGPRLGATKGASFRMASNFSKASFLNFQFLSAISLTSSCVIFSLQNIKKENNQKMKEAGLNFIYFFKTRMIYPDKFAFLKNLRLAL